MLRLLTLPRRIKDLALIAARSITEAIFSDGERMSYGVDGT